MAQQIIVTKDNYGIGLSCNFIDKNKNPIDLTDKVVEVVIVDSNNETIDIKQAVIVDYTNAKASIVLEKIHTSTLGLHKTFWSVLDDNQNITAQEDVYYYVKDKNNGSEGNVDSVVDTESVLKELTERTNNLNEQLDKNENKVNSIIDVNKSIMVDFIPYDYIIFDSFNRADSKNIGNVENSSSIEYVKFVDGGQDTAFEIKNNKLIGVVGNNKKAIIGVDCEYSDNIIIEAQMNEYTGIAFRVTDHNNFFYAWYQNDRVCITKFDSGVGTELLKYYIQNGSRANKLAVELSGNIIRLYLDDVFIDSIIDSFNNDKTIHGIYIRSNSDAPTRFVETFCIKKLKQVKNIQYNTLTSSIPFNALLENGGLSHSVVTNQLGTTFSLKKTDNFARSEMSMPYKQCNRYCEYSVDIKLHPNYEIDVNSGEIITQFHNYNISNVLSPVLALLTANGNYVINRLWSESRNPTIEQCEQESTIIGSYLDDIGKWVNWKYRINWGYTLLSKPFIEIYKNGILVYSRLFTPNCVNELYGAYFKCGVYKWDYVSNPNITNVTERTVSFRNLSILDN